MDTNDINSGELIAPPTITINNLQVRGAMRDAITLKLQVFSPVVMVAFLACIRYMANMFELAIFYIL
jgi:hypothetical protein